MEKKVLLSFKKNIGRNIPYAVLTIEVILNRQESGYTTIDGRHIEEYKNLSICGEGRRGAFKGSIGQIKDLFVRENLPKNTQWKALDRLLEIWERWHLNGMRAGCVHQIEEGWNKRPIDPTKPLDAYGRFLGEGKHSTRNMLVWVRPDEHPEGLLTKACPTCGYKYGTEWLVEELPEEIIEELKNMPDRI